MHPSKTTKTITLLLALGNLAGCAADGDINEWRRFSQPAQEQKAAQPGTLRRDYHLYVPDGLLATNEPAALVINLHGATPAPAFARTFGSYMQQIISGMPIHAADHGYIVAHPQGRLHGDSQYWVTRDNIDTGFINGLVDELSEELPVDPQRVFLTGFSSGGMLAWKLACEYSHRYAAIAPVAADRRAAPTCDSARPIPALGFHGTADPTVAYDGGISAMETWAAEHSCSDKVVFLDKDDTYCERWTGCNSGSDIRFCTSVDAGHTWPSGPGSIFISAAGYGKTSYTIDATDMIWSFFNSEPTDQ